MNSVEWSVPENIRWDAEVQKSFEECAPYHLRGATPKINHRQICFDIPTEVDKDWDAIGALSELVNKLARGMRDIRETLLDEHASGRTYQGRDPFEVLEEDGAIVQSSPGRYIYSGAFLDALNLLDRHIRNYALAIGAKEEVYPATVPTALLQRSGYLKSFPQHAFFVAPARLNEKAIAAVQQGRLVNNVEGADSREILQAPAETLAPTVCYHCFSARADQKHYDNEIVTSMNMCHRHEVANVRTLERLMTFRMREIIYFGETGVVTDALDRCWDWFLDMLRAWDVPFRATTATDPFFADSADSKRFFQTVRSLKREVRLFIPKTGKWISVASFNNHGNSLVDAFNIRGREDAKLTSACVGFGYERLIYGLMAIFGHDVCKWPSIPHQNAR